MNKKFYVFKLKTLLYKKRVFVMFSDKLSAAILQLCDAHKWSYEVASEHCMLSSRYFGDIARGKAVPSINTLEKLCIGFHLLPNDILVEPMASQELVFRIPLEVSECIGYQGLYGFTTYPICPQCQHSFDREYQEFCDRCGQRLCWRRYPGARIIFPKQEQDG
ncbi:MAG: helix-turn-helix domain-containing protein [Oscillospiraceae bacterium]|nr:helix-turn-helix domain-containing protein [Oscillospiraceae bacterium]